MSTEVASHRDAPLQIPRCVLAKVRHKVRRCSQPIPLTTAPSFQRVGRPACATGGTATAQQRHVEPLVARTRRACDLLDVSRAHLWRLEKGTVFPKRVQLGGTVTGFIVAELKHWVLTQPRCR